MHCRTQFRRCCLNQGGNPFSAKIATVTLDAESHAMLAPPVRTAPGDTLPSIITYHEQRGEKQSDHHDQLYLLSGGAPHAGNRRGVFPAGPSNANTFAWRERMKGRILGKMRSALMLLMFVTAQAHFSALAQCAPPSPPPPPGAQHPALLASYVLRPPWNVAGVDYAVGVPSTATLNDWQCLSGPGITVNTTAMPPYVRVDNTSNAVISGVDFSLHGGASLFFVNCPNPTVISSIFAGKNLTKLYGTAVIYADGDSPGLTVSYNTINGAGAGTGGTLVAAAGAGTTTLTYNWLKHFPQHVLEILVQSAPYSVVYKYNLIERGGMQAGDHLNYLQIEANPNSSSVDVEYNTSYQTWQATGGEGYQFTSGGSNLVQSVTLAYNVMIAAPTPGHPLSMSRMIHADGSLNAPATAHDNYVDPTGSYGWLYYGSFFGWNVYNNYNMTTGAIMPAS
jgi:hypothetical protein